MQVHYKQLSFLKVLIYTPEWREAIEIKHFANTATWPGFEPCQGFFDQGPNA